MLGLELLNPPTASQSDVVRAESFLNSEEIGQIEEAAQLMKAMNPVPNWDTIYLQNKNNFFERQLPGIHKKIQQLVTDVDEKHFGMLPELEKSIGTTDGVNARCIEFHEYGAHAREGCGPHMDTGSLYTVDIMLSSTNDFEGGSFITDSHDYSSGANNDTSVLHNQVEVFERGDAIVFISHKQHSVTPITSGTRCVLVLEFWEGSACQKPHRCMNPSCTWRYDEENIQ